MTFEIVDAADPALGAADLAQVGADVDAPADPLDERGIEPGQSRDVA